MKKRYIFASLLNHLKKDHITLIVGPRQTGKTTILRQIQSEIDKAGYKSFFLNLEDTKLLNILNQHPENLFQLIAPLDLYDRQIVLIDEIQYLDNPSNFLKYLFDEYREKLKLIVTGSSSFYIDQKFKDSLAGRKRIFQLLTLSFEEFLYFKDRTDLIDLVHAGQLPILFRNEFYHLLQEYLLYGGYPEVVIEKYAEEKKLILKELASSYVKKDAVEANLKYPDNYLSIFTILANRTSIINTRDIGRDLGMDHLSVIAYLSIMEKSMHITQVKPFYRNIEKEIRKSPKIFFNDLGLRNFFIHNFKPILLREDKGDLLENFVFRRFLDHYDDMDIRFWRTQKKQEVDFIIREKMAYEVKFSKSGYKPNKYAYFQTKYPDIPLHLIHYENVLEVNFEE